VIDGVLVVDKPRGMTSHDVVVSIRKAFKLRKIGHTGTLDPMATGILALVIGRATRLSRYLTGGDKRYHATITLGATTDTMDGDGQIVSRQAITVSEAEVRALVPAFVGTSTQVPPMYSAKKVGGKHLYELARQGIEIEREPKQITIYAIEVCAVHLPDLELDVHCSAGTYLRVLAADLGARLGCGAYLSALARTAVGPYDSACAHPLQDIVAGGIAAQRYIIPLERALPHLARIDLSAEAARRIIRGEALKVADLASLQLPANLSEGQRVTLFGDDGALVAVARVQAPAIDFRRAPGHLPAIQPERVLIDSNG
jgi:tRNA pseudouridine55 synthase